jgi:hypothetical protein
MCGERLAGVLQLGSTTKAQHNLPFQHNHAQYVSLSVACISTCAAAVGVIVHAAVDVLAAEVSRLGVKSVYTPRGMTAGVWQQGLQMFADADTASGKQKQKQKQKATRAY